MKEKLHIYIVEDEKIVALDISNHLRAIGHHVLGISASGEDCLEVLKTVKPDLILMDINLAGKMTGIETAARINAVMNIPIVFLTAYTDDNTLKEIKRTGYYGYVTKPFKEIELKTEIEFAIDRFNKLLKLKQDHDASRTTLRETEEFFRQVVNNVSDIIYRIDLRGYFTYLNPSAINQTGYSKMELLTMKYTSLIRSDYKHKAYMFFKNIYQQNVENSYFEFPLITKKGDEIWIGQKIHLLKSNNRTVGFQVIARDITNEKAFKEQLIIAKKNAENTALLKSQFLANMSHEIRTPLNGIVGLIHLLEKTELSLKQRTYVNAIMTSSNQLLGVISDVLDLSKIEAGKMEIVSNEFDLHELIQAVVSIFELRTSEKGIELNFTVDKDVPQHIIGDSIRLNQILYNLLSNAVKFTEHGSVNLEASVLFESDDEVKLEFKVKDSGIGMTEEFGERVFETFTQAEGETTRKYGGSGLGLAIVKKLVEIQNGAIEVQTKEGEGSQFIFSIPYKKLKKRVEVAPAPVKEFDMLKGIKILLVEDNPINQLVTKDLLEDVGVQVEVAGNGQIAIDLLQEHKYDVILMDMQMPVKDGYQAIEEIRASEDEVLSNVPIIALTANAIDTEIKKCYSSGANDYLSKPFKPDSLFLKIQHLLHRNMDSSAEYSLEPIDVKTLENFTNGKIELVHSTLNELRKAFVVDYNSLNESITNQDYKQVRAIAHKIKPNFFIVGLKMMGELCKTIEHSEDEKTAELVKILMVNLPKIVQEIDEITKDKSLHLQTN